MDARDIAYNTPKWYHSFDRRSMTVEVILIHEEPYDEDGVPPSHYDEEVVTFPVKFEICDLCQGHGRHVNPSIDAHGISAYEFDEDPDFAEDYLSGMYDVPCYQCDGQKVVPVIDEENVSDELHEKLDQFYEDQREDARCRAGERREREMELRMCGCY